jgi:two-component system OmpR family response regulator
MKPHILIIDDEATIRDLLAQFLTVSDYRVTAVESAAAALRVVQQDPPQLIISDLQLEDADGLEMIGQFKEALPAAPVILLTGVLFEPEVVRDVLSKKVACYLEKTSSLARILETVRDLLAQPRPPGKAGQ